MAGRNEKNNNEKTNSAERIWATAQLYCDQVREIGKAVLQYSHCTCDTAQALGVRALGVQAKASRGAGRLACGSRASRREAWGAQPVGTSARHCDTVPMRCDTVG